MNLRPIPISSLFLKVCGCLCLCLLCRPSKGQDTTQAGLWWKQGIAYADSLRSDSAEKYFELAQQAFLQLGNNYGDSSLWKRYFESNLNVLWQKKASLSLSQDPADLQALIEESREFETFYSSKVALQISEQASLYSFRGRVLVDMDKEEEGIEALLQAVDLYVKSKKASAKRIATCYGDIAMGYKKQALFEESITYYEKSNKILRDIGDQSEVSRNYMGIASTYRGLGQTSRSLEYLQKALKIVEEEHGKFHVKAAQIRFNIHTALELLGRFPESIQQTKQALRIFEKFHMPIDLGRCTNALGILYKKIDRYDSAVYFFKQAFEYSIESDNEVFSGLVTNNIGNLYSRTGQPDSSIKYYLVAKSYFDKDLPPKHPYLIMLLANAGGTYDDLGDFDNAEIFLKTSIQNNSRDSKFLQSIYNRSLGSLGNLYITWEKSDSSIKYTQMEIQSLKSIIADYPEEEDYLFELAGSYQTLGLAYADLDDAQSAIHFFEESIAIISDLKQDATAFLGRLQYNLANGGHFLNDEFLEAIVVGKSSIDNIKQSYGPHNTHLLGSYFIVGKSYYNLDSLDQAIAYSDTAIQIISQIPESDFENLKEKIIAYRFRSKLRQKQGNLEKSLDLNYKAIQALHQIYQSSGETSSYFSSKQEFFHLFEDGLNVLDLPDAQSAIPDHESFAFRYVEQSKSLSMIQQTKVASISDSQLIPQGITEEDKKIRKELNQYSQKITEGSSNDSLLSIYQKKLISLELKKDSLYAYIKKNHPEFYQLKFSTETISIEEVQRQLSGDQAILEYLLADTSLFVFVLSTDTFIFHKINRDPLLEIKVEQFIRSLYLCPKNAPLNCNSQPQEEVYQDLGQELFSQLIRPIEAFLPQRIIIIPDGVLSYLPFEALLSGDIESGQALEQYFWIQEKIISYAFSATLWAELKAKHHRRRTHKHLLAIAPNFDNTSESPEFANRSAYRSGFWGPLPFAQKEVDSILSIIPGDLISQDQASIQTFQSIAEEYRILHFATHGKITENPPNAMLAFAPSQDTSANNISFLYLTDTYTLELNADLVVLSACETGIGKLYRGEGIASLARGFTYAGAKSIVPSLWSVNDQSTAFLMQRFYQYLADGEPKDVALRQAKLDLIDEGQSHPFHWAAFVLMGDESPIEFSRSCIGYWLAAGGIILLLFGFLFWRKKRGVA